MKRDHQAIARNLVYIDRGARNHSRYGDIIAAGVDENELISRFYDAASVMQSVWVIHYQDEGTIPDWTRVVGHELGLTIINNFLNNRAFMNDHITSMVVRNITTHQEREHG